MEKAISYTTVVLFVLMTVLSFVLSYDALRHVAEQFGKGGVLAYIWPVLIDGGLVIFSMSAVRAGLRGQSTLKPWTLIVLFTAGTVYFNIVHSDKNIIAVTVAVVAPLVLFLTFETLMDMLKDGARRQGVVQSLSDLQAQLDSKQKTLDALLGQIEKFRTEAEDIKRETGKTSTRTDTDERRQRLVRLVERRPGISKTELSDELGVVRSTVYNDINELKTVGILHENGNGLEVAR